MSTVGSQHAMAYIRNYYVDPTIGMGCRRFSYNWQRGCKHFRSGARLRLDRGLSRLWKLNAKVQGLRERSCGLPNTSTIEASRCAATCVIGIRQAV